MNEVKFMCPECSGESYIVTLVCKKCGGTDKTKVTTTENGAIYTQSECSALVFIGVYGKKVMGHYCRRCGECNIKDFAELMADEKVVEKL